MARKKDANEAAAGDETGVKSALSSLTSALADLSKAVMVDARDEVSREVGQALREASEEITGAAQSVRANATEKKTKSDETRARIMEAGAKLFAERGYEGAGVTDIAKAAGFTKGALYAHFPSKEDLFVTIAAEATWAREDQTPDPSEMCQDLDVDALDPALAQDILLGLETAMFMIRHPEAAADLREVYRNVLTKASLALDGKGPEAAAGDQPSERAFDALISMSGVNTHSILMTLATGDPRVDASRKRVITRLTQDLPAS